METLIDLLKATQLNMLETGIALLFIFVVGYLLGIKKAKKLTHEIYALQKEVLDLNEELLYGTETYPGGAPVIGLKPVSLSSAKIAK